MVAMCHWCLGYVHVRVWGCEAAAYHLDSLGETPHPVIGTIRAIKDYIRVSLHVFLLHHYYRVGGPNRKPALLEVTV